MKSMRKFATLAVGAILAASAVAAVSIDTTSLSGYKFFNVGEPAVKVVIGAAAQPSDVVVAANIAAMIGNLAYTDQSVSVLGTDGVGCGAAAGTCAGSNVTLSVTVPGGVSSANAYTMRTYINSDINNNPDQGTYKGTTTLYDGGISSYTNADQITSDKTALLSVPNNGLVTATNTNGNNIKQTQTIYFGALTKYDSSTSVNAVVGSGLRASYTIAFNNPLPLCWDTSKDGYSGTACSTSNRLDQTHTTIDFLGQPWVIIDYTVASDNTKISSMDIGKEAQYNPDMNIGDTITTNGTTVKLISVSPFGYGTNSNPYASFQVTSPSGVVTPETLQAGSEQDVAGVTLKVNNVFPGVNNVNYVDVSVFSDKVTLSTGQQIDSTTNQYWNANIASANSSSTQAIDNITVYSTYPYVTSNDEYTAGQALSLIRGDDSFDFTYQGTNAASVTSDGLSFSIQNTTTPYNSTAQWTGPFVQVNSGLTDAFQYGTTYQASARIAMQALVPTTGMGMSNAPVGTVFIQNTNGFWVPQSGTVAVPAASNLTYHYSGSESAPIGVVGNSIGSVLWIAEYDQDNMAGNPSYITALYDPSQGTAGEFTDQLGGTTTSKVGFNSTYPGVGSGSYLGAATPTYQSGFISDRGVALQGSVGTTSLMFQYPAVPVKATYTLTAGGAVVNASGSSTTLTLGAGQSGTIAAGYVATVQSINAASTGGSGASGVTGLSGITASPAKANVITALSTDTNPLVMLDSDPSAATTASEIVVGGPIVNTLAKSAGISVQSGDTPVVAVQGGKIYVYGWTGADTTAAGNALIAWLGQNRATISG